MSVYPTLMGVLDKSNEKQRVKLLRRFTLKI
jgi:hypothetical protein